MPEPSGNKGHTARLKLAFVVVTVLLMFTLVYPTPLTVVRDAREIDDNDCKGGGGGLRGRGAGGGLGELEDGGGGGRGGEVTKGRTTRHQSTLHK